MIEIFLLFKFQVMQRGQRKRTIQFTESLMFQEKVSKIPARADQIIQSEVYPDTKRNTYLYRRRTGGSVLHSHTRSGFGAAAEDELCSRTSSSLLLLCLLSFSPLAAAGALPSHSSPRPAANQRQPQHPGPAPSDPVTMGYKNTARAGKTLDPDLWIVKPNPPPTPPQFYGLVKSNTEAAPFIRGLFITPERSILHHWL